MDPEDTSMCSLEGWRVSLFSTSSSMFWLFPPLPGAFVGVISLCARESGGGELGDVLSFFCLRVKVAAGAVSAGSTTLTLVLD